MKSQLLHLEQENVNKIHRSPSLENQIETMLDKVMDADNEVDDIDFSDNNECSDEQVNYYNDISNGFFNSNLFQSSTTSEEPDKSSDAFSFHRATKKFPTISFNSCNSSNAYNQNMYMNFNQNVPFNIGTMVIPMCQRNPLMPLNQNVNVNNQFVRNDKRRNTYNIRKEEAMNTLSYSTHNSGSNSPCSPCSPCVRKNKRPSGFANIDKEKRFSTMAFPKGTNMQIEMLLYELTNALVKTEKIDYFIYSKLQGNFVNVIKTHKGSRMFQNYLKNTQSDILHQIFNEISPSLPDIISDSYANYFCKRFFTFLNQKDRVDFLKAIQSSMVTLSMDSIGTYPIQAIIEQVGSKIEKNIIISSIQNSISELCYNTYGSHVLEKIVCCFEEEFTSFIYDYVYNIFISLAYNINGICIVKKILTLTHKKELHEKLKKLSYENAYNLIQHSCGNYVIQVIVEEWETKEIIEVISQFNGKYVNLSMQKYSSNVVERCIEKDELILGKYIKEICESDRIAEVMKNNFGNYVIQKALKISKGEIKNLLISTVSRNISKLNDKKLISKWKSIVGGYTDKSE